MSETDLLDLPSRLERGEALTFAAAPFELPRSQERALLMKLNPERRAPQDLILHLSGQRLENLSSREKEFETSLIQILNSVAESVSGWLANILPTYASQLRPIRVHYQPIEEVRRRLPLSERVDLLHLDSEKLPSEQWRTLNVQINLHREQPRTLVTSDRFSELLKRFGKRAGLPGTQESWAMRAIQSLPRLLFPRPGSELADFVDRFHQFLRRSECFQERSSRRVEPLPPGGVWLAMTDVVSHAVLRGQYALEVVYHIPPEVLSLPEESPASLVEQFCRSDQRRAA